MRQRAAQRRFSLAGGRVRIILGIRTNFGTSESHIEGRVPASQSAKTGWAAFLFLVFFLKMNQPIATLSLTSNFLAIHASAKSLLCAGLLLRHLQASDSQTCTTFAIGVGPDF